MASTTDLNKMRASAHNHDLLREQYRRESSGMWPRESVVFSSSLSRVSECDPFFAGLMNVNACGSL